MAAVIPQTTEESVADAKRNAPKYFKQVSDLTMRRRLILRMMEQRGRVEYNAGSYAHVWTVEYSQPTVTQNPSGGDLDFQEHDALKQFHVGKRGYKATDYLSEASDVMNKGPTAITNELKDKTVRLAKRLNQAMNSECYVDGNASGNTERFLGFESFLGDDGACTAGDLVAVPDDTYAGQDTGLGAEGSWPATLTVSPNAALGTDWPHGLGSSEYDWNAPLLVNWGSSGWGTGSSAWIENCEFVLSFARIMQTNRGARESETTPFMHMLATDLYSDFLNFYRSRLRMDVPHPEAANLGFGNTMNFEGDMVHYEGACPAGVGYGISPEQLEMFIYYPELFKVSGPEYFMPKAGYLWFGRTLGNMRAIPKFFAKYKQYAA